jgi:glycosyltransferase involved in cell wall biosynthesis
MSPRVSILMPVFNAADTLEVCIDSIQRQTMADFECVIVDDGSTDLSLAIARKAAGGDPRIRVFAEPHRGLVHTLNVGIDACSAPLIARMDADDEMHEKRLELQVNALSDGDLAGVGCHVHIFSASAVGEGRLAYQQWLNSIRTPEDVARDVFIECPIAHPTLVVRRDALHRMRYRDEGWPEDYDLVQRMLAEGCRLGMVPSVLLSWRDGPDRLSRTDERYTIDAFTRCRAHFLAQTFLREHQEYVLWGYGGTGKALRRALLEHGKRVHAFVELHPGRLGQVIHGAPVIAYDALPTLRGRPLLTSVAGAQPREQIRAALRAMEFSEGSDYVCCA